MPPFDTPVYHPNFEGHQQDAGRVVITEAEVDEVWYAERRVIRNQKRQGSYLMRGLTRSGRMITVVLLPTGDPTAWLVYTAW